MLPIFRSNYSLKSILTLDGYQKPEDRKKGRADSIINICKDKGISDVFIADNNLSGLVEAYENCKKADLKLHFGYRVTICSDITDKTAESRKTESKIIIFARKGTFQDLIKLHNIANTDGNYDGVPRLDYKTLKENWTENLLMVIPFYDSYLFQNLLYGANCLPELDFADPYYTIESNGLPFDHLVTDRLKKTVDPKKIIESKTIYYNNREDFSAYMVYRCILNKSNFQKPELPHFSSQEFCMEAINDAR